MVARHLCIYLAVGRAHSLQLFDNDRIWPSFLNHLKPCVRDTCRRVTHTKVKASAQTPPILDTASHSHHTVSNHNAEHKRISKDEHACMLR